ncbi:MAG: NAD(P)/FAD-dependent oxidoreductase [Prevotella sp.]|nr:NAD(P)/FAD-dependent oxidoreductase [Prevotella sp.]MCM1074120.1 NAD(P)/FAD-dependent oxidoreductase [Ruminococcus sp.]
MDNRERILIIGGGFAGLNLAKRLNPNLYQVHLLDRNNFHGFPPLFYQVASSGLDASSIAFPLRREFRRIGKNTTYHMGHVKNIDLAAKSVVTSYETISYDKLVIAAGTTNNFFGMADLNEKVFCIKTIAEASHTRDEILDRLERGALCKDPERRRQLLSFLVVGGGPSGVEIAGALGEMKKDILPREYPELKADDVRIVLVEGSGSLLGAMDSRAGVKAKEYLADLMVEVRLNTVMKSYADKQVTFADGTSEYWETLIWTAGVVGETMPGLPAEIIGHGGRILTDDYCRVKGCEDVYAIGDIALCQTPEAPKGHPQVAQVAIQMAKTLAQNLNEKKNLQRFVYKDKGSMATIGKGRAVVDMKGRFISGLLAWWAWMLIHLISILGMRNKLTVFITWCWNYLTYSTSLRLLFRPTKYPLRRHWGD